MRTFLSTTYLGRIGMKREDVIKVEESFPISEQGFVVGRILNGRRMSDITRYGSHGSVVVSKHGLYAGSPGSIPTAVTTMTAAGGDAEHVSLNH